MGTTDRQDFLLDPQPPRVRLPGLTRLRGDVPGGAQGAQRRCWTITSASTGWPEGPSRWHGRLQTWRGRSAATRTVGLPRLRPDRAWAAPSPPSCAGVDRPGGWRTCLPRLLPYLALDLGANASVHGRGRRGRPRGRRHRPGRPHVDTDLRIGRTVLRFDLGWTRRAPRTPRIGSPDSGRPGSVTPNAVDRQAPTNVPSGAAPGPDPASSRGAPGRWLGHRRGRGPGARRDRDGAGRARRSRPDGTRASGRRAGREPSWCRA